MTSIFPVPASRELAQARVLRRVVIGCQAVVWGAHILAGVLLLVAVVQKGGLVFAPFAPHSGDLADPADVLHLGAAGRALVDPIALIVFLGLFPAMMMALIGVLALVPPAARSRMLFLSTALTLATVATQISPWGALLRTWLLD